MNKPKYGIKDILSIIIDGQEHKFKGATRIEQVVENNKEKLQRIAEQNTKRNEDGSPVSDIDDVWREDENVITVCIDKENAKEVFSLPYYFETNSSTEKYTTLSAYEKGIFDTLKALGIDADELEDYMHGEGIVVPIDNDLK